MKNSKMINLKPEQRNNLLCSLSGKLETPGNRHLQNLDAEKYPILAYILQDSLIDEQITNVIYNN